MELMENEKILLTSDNKELTLTTHRVRFQSIGSGFGSVISFLLSELDSCEITLKSNPFLLMIAIFTLIAGILLSRAFGGELAMGLLFFITVILIFVYFLTIKTVLKISSVNSHIFVTVKRKNLKKIIDFMDTVESAKNDYQNKLTNNEYGGVGF